VQRVILQWHIARDNLGNLVEPKSTQPRWIFYSLRKMYFYVFNRFANDIRFYYRTDNMLTICFGCFKEFQLCWNINDVYELMHEWKCDLNWFEEFDCLLLLWFKLRKYQLMSWCVKLFMDLYQKHELKIWSMKWNVLF
jgi:hypothetical protein